MLRVVLAIIGPFSWITLPSCAESASETSVKPAVHAEPSPAEPPAEAGSAPAAPALPPGTNDYVAGLDLLQQGSFVEAVAALDRAIEANDEVADFITARGVAKTLAEDFPGALKDLNRSLRLRQNDRETRLWVGVAQKMSNDHMEASKNFVHGKDVPAQYADFVFNTMATEYASSRYQGEYYDNDTHNRVQVKEPVRRNFKRGAGMFVARHKTAGMNDGGVAPGVASALVDRSRTLVDQGKYAEAVSDLENLLRASPDDLNVLELHARCALGLGDALTAREELTRVLTANTRHVAAYLARAKAQAMIGAQRRAKSDLEIASRLDRAATDRARSEIQALFGKQTSQSLDPSKAAASLKQSAESGASATELRKQALEVLYALNDRRLRCDEVYQENIQKLEEAVTAAPKDPNRLAALADYLYQESSVQREKVEPRAEPKLFRHQTTESQNAELDRAMKLCDEALAINSKHVGAMTTKAATLSWRQKYSEAQAIAQTALEISPKDTRLLQMMASLLEVAAGQKSAQAAGLRETKSWYSGDWMYTRWPSKRDLQEANTLELIARELEALAHAHLEKAVAGLKGTAEGFYLQGTLAHDRGDQTQAKEALEQAVKLKPDYREAWAQLAGIYSDLNLTNESVMARSTAANLVHTTAAHLLVLAQVQVNRTAFRSALEVLEKAKTLDPADARSFAYAAILNEANEKPKVALAEWRAAVALLEAAAQLHGQPVETMQATESRPMNPDVFGLLLCTRFRLARALEAAGEKDAALEHYKALLAIKSRVSPDAMIEPLPSATLPDPEGDLTRVPEADPPALFFAWAHLGVAYGEIKAENWDEAQLHLTAIARLQNSWPATRDGRQRLSDVMVRARIANARVLLGQGNIDMAFHNMDSSMPKNLPPDVQKEYKEVQDEVRRRRNKGW